MKTYTLTAYLGKQKSRKTIHASSQSDAMWQAMAHVMDSAHADQDGPWASGTIILDDPAGYALYTMDARA